MRLRKPLTDAVCPRCTSKFLANDYEIRPNVVRCPRCGNEAVIKYPPAYEEELGCFPLIVAAVIFFLLAKLTGGGGVFGVLLGIVLGIGIPFGLAVLVYHVSRWSDE